MAFELLAAGLVGGAFGGYFALRRWFARRRSKASATPPTPASDGALAGALGVGDVVGIGNREYWLTSGYSLHEAGHAIYRVFAADDVRLVLALGAQPTLYLGHQLSLILPSELPARLEHLDQSFSLRARVPVEVVPDGREASPAGSALWGRYEDGGEHTLWVLRAPEGARGLLTRRVPERDIMRWGNASLAR